jgi:tetratricopeptide (TPR) repeat protein
MPLLLALLLLLPLPVIGVEVPPLLRPGAEASAAGLWEIAALRFDNLLREPTLPRALKPQVAIRLAEAWIHTGNSTNALSLLRESFVANHPETYFWKAQALAATGRFADAINALEPAMESAAAAHRNEAIFTRASLQLALAQPAAALLTLKPLTTDPDVTTAAHARLRQAEILLDQGDADNARATLPAAAEIAPADRPQAGLINARLLLAEGNPDAAIPVFSALLEQPQGQTLARYHAAAIGLADALAAQGSPAAAADSLIVFIETHPDSALLTQLFGRLLHWLPDPPDPNDPILAQLARWIPPLPPPPPDSIAASASNDAVAVWPVSVEPSDLAAHALYFRACGLFRLKTPAAEAEARSLLTRLRLDYPEHPLALQALLQTGRWLLAQGRTQQALGILDSTLDLASEPAIKGEALFLKAQAAFAQDQHPQAATLFEAAARSLTAQAADTARLNAAIAHLRQGKVITITTTDENSRMSPGTLADLELEQALAATPPAAAKTALENFLNRHPEHPRCPEARLAVSEAALATTPPDLATAKAQLDTLATAAAKPLAEPLPPARLALARLRLADLSNTPKETIAAARAFLETFASDPSAPDVSLLLGRTLFQAGDYNPARMTLEKLAASDPSPPRAQAAWLLAARAAALVPSPQSREEAVGLFDHAIGIKAPLAAIASLEKARLLIDLNRLAEAATFLRTWYEGLAKDDPLRLPAGFLLGEAITQEAGDDPKHLAEALTIYQKLLAHPRIDPATRHRLKYLCGQTLELLPNPKDPTTKRTAEALEAYYSVLETAAETPPAEWDWFERCGFRALEIYENAHRWQSAIAIAKKIASCNGPRAAEAANRARILQLKHMVWED